MTASLLAHAGAVALFLAWAGPSVLPLRVRSPPVTLIAPRFDAPAPVVRKTSALRPFPTPALSPALLVAPRTVPRAFHITDKPIQTPEPVLTVPEPPSFKASAVQIQPGPQFGTRLNLPPLVFKVNNLDDAPVPKPAPAPRVMTAPGGFGNTSVAARPPPEMPRPLPGKSSPSTFSSAEILFKPRPVYTADARRLQIEGEVLLEIQFTASGEARVLRLVHGLGHGLDETAMAAAREIRFQPARRDGAPVDSRAIVHIAFQLAY